MAETSEESPKLTRNQLLVFNVLANAAQPLGAYAILDELRVHGFKAPPQVYRALSQLALEGLIHKVESLNAWTVCCGNHDANPPVFAICNDCGSVTEHFDEGLSQNLETMSKESGFTPDRSIIEIHGQCDDCFTYKTQ